MKKLNGTQITILIIFLVLLFVAWSMGKGITDIFTKPFEFFGDIFKPSEQDRERDEQVEDALEDANNGSGTGTAVNPWNSTDWKKHFADGRTPMPTATARQIAKTIWDSVGTFSDEPENGLGAIKRCRTRSEVSFVAFYFNHLYLADLFTWLTNKYDTSHQKQVLLQIDSYAKSLPNK